MKDVIAVCGIEPKVLKYAAQTVINFDKETPEFMKQLLKDTEKTEEYRTLAVKEMLNNNKAIENAR